MTESPQVEATDAQLPPWLAEDSPARERELQAMRLKLRRTDSVETFGRRSCVAAGGSAALSWFGMLASMKLDGQESLAVAAGILAILTPLLSIGGVILVLTGRFCFQQVRTAAERRQISCRHLMSASNASVDPDEQAPQEGRAREIQEAIDEQQDQVFHWETICVACGLVLAVAVPLGWLEYFWPEQIWMLWTLVMWVQIGVLVVLPFGAAGWLSAWLAHRRLSRCAQAEA